MQQDRDIVTGTPHPVGSDISAVSGELASVFMNCMEAARKRERPLLLPGLRRRRQGFSSAVDQRNDRTVSNPEQLKICVSMSAIGMLFTR
jgi:hypothetical protein